MESRFSSTTLGGNQNPKLMGYIDELESESYVL